MTSSNSAYKLRIINRLTALWAFSEAALGGLLHAFKVPFSGLIIASLAVIIIAYISYESEDKRVIIKSTLIVVAVKIIASPQSPVTAHIAVLLQGFAGYFIYRVTGFGLAGTVSHGIFALTYSALQKLITLTLIFGTEFWTSVDIFTKSVIKEFTKFHDILYNHSIVAYLVGGYLLLYFLTGIAAGVVARSIPTKVAESKERILKLYSEQGGEIVLSVNARSQHNVKKMLLAAILLILIPITYFIPVLFKDNNLQIFYMLIRAISVIIIWTYLLSPLLRKMIQTRIFKKVSRPELDQIIALFPEFRKRAVFARNYSRSFSGINRITTFLSVLITIVVYD